MDLVISSAPARTLVRCRVCGFAEVHTDHVVDRGLVLLATCPRCDHRWTERASGVPARVSWQRTERIEAA